MRNSNLTTPAILTVILSLCLIAPTVSADVMTFNGTELVSNVKLHAPGLPSDGRTVPAGLYSYTYQGAQLAAFCVDLGQYAATTEVSEQDISFLRNGDMVAFLYETYSPSVQTGTDAAALGVAIWEVLYELDQNEFSASDGYFLISQNEPVRLAADDLLDTLPDSYQPQTDLVVLHSENKQDMLIGSFGEVPEPVTAALLLLSTPLILVRRHRRRAV